MRHDSYLVDWSGVPYWNFLLRKVARGEPVLRRLSVTATLLRNARGHLSRLIHSHCMSAGLLAERIGVGSDVQAALAFTFERYDGGGLPAGAQGGQIPLAVRVAQLADMAEFHHRSYGLEGAVAMALSRRGGQFDPQVVDAFVGDAERILAGPPTGDAWRAALQEAPDRHQQLDEQSLDDLLIALGDCVDLKCPFTIGHSRVVAQLAGDAAKAVGLDADTVALTRRAGHAHDLGRIGISSNIWSKAGPLTAAEFEGVRLHPYLTVRILNQVPGLGQLAQLAGNHHERVDGRGYPRGLGETTLGLPDRVLAAAVCYQSGCENSCARGDSTPSPSMRSCTPRTEIPTAQAAPARHPTSRSPRRSSSALS